VSSLLVCDDALRRSSGGVPIENPVNICWLCYIIPIRE
jgi:hypothetical protein